LPPKNTIGYEFENTVNLYYSFKFLFMKKNLGKAHTILRLLLAVLCAYLYFDGIITGTWGLIVLLLAGLYLFTGLTGYAPLYAIFNMSTRRSKKNVEKP